MKFDDYLNMVLGKKKARELKQHKRAEKDFIVVAGPQGPTGKSTLCRVLEKHGYHVVEGYRVYTVELNKMLKDEEMIQGLSSQVE